jgi:hypothetical protein
MLFETVSVSGFKGGIFGMRHPLKSYKRADTDFNQADDENFVIGENDYDLAKRLCKAGSEHRKWMRGVVVWVNIEAPLFFYSELDTYSTRLYENSQSTMHTLKKDQIERDSVEFDWFVDEECDHMMEETLRNIIKLQEKMNENPEKHEFYHRMAKALLPCGWRQTRLVCLNYETLHSMYKQRKNHRLPQWSEDFVEWIETLPYKEFITENFD